MQGWLTDGTVVHGERAGNRRRSTTGRADQVALISSPWVYSSSGRSTPACQKLKKSLSARKAHVVGASVCAVNGVEPRPAAKAARHSHR